MWHEWRARLHSSAATAGADRVGGSNGVWRKFGQCMFRVLVRHKPSPMGAGPQTPGQDQELATSPLTPNVGGRRLFNSADGSRGCHRPGSGCPPSAPITGRTGTADSTATDAGCRRGTKTPPAWSASTCCAARPPKAQGPWSYSTPGLSICPACRPHPCRSGPPLSRSSSRSPWHRKSHPPAAQCHPPAQRHPR